MRRLVLVMLLVGMGQSAPDTARSAPGNLAKARQHYQRGRLLYSQGKFRAAIAQFTQAQSFRRHPIIRFNLGQCHRQLREWAKALFCYKLYLSELPRASNRTEVRRFIRDMARKAAQAARLRQLGKLSVVTQPAGAQLFVNRFGGTPHGTSPTTLSLKAGQYVLEVRLPGYHTVYHKVSITVGKVTLLRLALQRLAPVRSVLVRPRPRPRDVWIPPPLPEITRPQPRPRRRMDPPARRRRIATSPPGSKGPRPFYKTKWFWSGVAVGVGSVALTGVFGKLALDKEKAWDKVKYSSNPDRDIQRQGRAFAVTADVFLAVGLVSIAAVTTAAIIVALKQKKERRSKAPILPACGARGCGLWMQGRF